MGEKVIACDFPVTMTSKQIKIPPLACQFMKVKNAALPRLGQLGDSDLRLLKVFKSVADCGGMVAAELELNVGISTISRHIKDLETRLGLTVCRRGRSGFALTAEGQRIYEETTRFLAAADVFRTGVDDVHRRMGGQLEIGVFDKTATNPASMIGEAIRLFAEAAPEVALQIQVATINSIERKLIDGSLHVGVIPAHRSSESLEYDKLFDETMLLYCGTQHPLSAVDQTQLDWQDIARYKFAGLGYHSPNMEASQRAGLRRAATGLDQESIATLILSGQFLGFLPDHYAEVFETTGRMRAIRPEVLRYTCDFVCVMRHSPEPARSAQVFRNCLLKAHGAALRPSPRRTRGSS
jgi:LysR family transcriptional regulator, transcriptional activator for bauABCD operon